MESTFDGTKDHAHASGHKLKSHASDAANDAKSAASGEIKSLIADVEDLVSRIADLKDADVVRVRGKVMKAVDTVKDSLSGGAETVRRQAKFVASSTDEYVRQSPWQAVGIAALVGAIVGILATRRS